VNNLSRKAASYILNLGPQHWIIMPLEHTDSKDQLSALEGK
jgi:hypothetical protein